MAKRPSVEALAGNILSVYEKARPEHIREGRAWYRDAHELARDIGLAHGVSTRKAAGVIAALSPRVHWDKNPAYAAQFLATGYAPGFGMNRRNAARIVQGEDPASVLHGPKVRAFFECILSPGNHDYVCIDSHAHDIAIGKRYGERKRDLLHWKDGYDLLVQAYRLTAQTLGIPTIVLQPTTWLAWRDYKPQQLTLELGR